MGPQSLSVRVQAVERLAKNINLYELRRQDGSALPQFTAGAHIDVAVRDGCVRQYSLCNDPKEQHRYRIAVQREENGRGGSRAIFDEFRPLTNIVISEPRNNFALREDAKRSLLLAGGIGITPMMSMLHRLRSIDADFILHYATRSAERTAFLNELTIDSMRSQVFIHHDSGDPARMFKIQPIVQEYEEGTHLYFCGPASFMAAVRNSVIHWPAKQVHFEYFNVPSARNELDTNQEPLESTNPLCFFVHLAVTGATFEVAPNRTIVEVLRANGIAVPTSCESGLCGTCRTRYIAGVPDHRDYILNDEERSREVLICCARSKTTELVLDL